MSSPALEPAQIVVLNTNTHKNRYSPVAYRPPALLKLFLLVRKLISPKNSSPPHKGVRKWLVKAQEIFEVGQVPCLRSKFLA